MGKSYKELSANGKLDAVLNFMYDKKQYATLDEIILGLGVSKNDEDAEYRLEIGFILIQLSDVDKVLYYKKEIDRYTIIFAGKRFKESGGYQGEHDRQVAESERAESIERHQVRMSENSLFVNKWIMRGTVGAAIATSLYLIWTVFSYGLDHHWWFAPSCCHCH